MKKNKLKHKISDDYFDTHKNYYYKTSSLQDKSGIKVSETISLSFCMLYMHFT